jgi:hypothetical protein
LTNPDPNLNPNLNPNPDPNPNPTVERYGRVHNVLLEALLMLENDHKHEGEKDSAQAGEQCDERRDEQGDERRGEQGDERRDEQGDERSDEQGDERRGEQGDELGGATAAVKTAVKTAAGEAAARRVPAAPTYSPVAQMRVSGWMNISSAHDFNTLHDHGEALWAAVYFVEADDHALMVLDAGAAVYSGALLLKTQLAPWTTDFGFLPIQPRPGELWIFPGCVDCHYHR